MLTVAPQFTTGWSHLGPVNRGGHRQFGGVPIWYGWHFAVGVGAGSLRGMHRPYRGVVPAGHSHFGGEPTGILPPVHAIGMISQ
jgi:hypothetical protein